ncbi:hypothetical protein L218DRAFT_939815 [Marasmius fiardii PR-910]|nr:hypothetical protein L218DRAFT_939815 [Marasmius fiardii PR-910]
MYCNAANQVPLSAGKNTAGNTDGINTYRSDQVTLSLRNWEVTYGDDCLAIKGNSTNILAENITCRGGNGLAFESLGITQFVCLDSEVQPSLSTGMDVLFSFAFAIGTSEQESFSKVYFKTWTGAVDGKPPIDGGGGGGGLSSSVVFRAYDMLALTQGTFEMLPQKMSHLTVALFQTNHGDESAIPSQIMFNELHFENWT